MAGANVLRLADHFVMLVEGLHLNVFFHTTHPKRTSCTLFLLNQTHGVPECCLYSMSTDVHAARSHSTATSLMKARCEAAFAELSDANHF